MLAKDFETILNKIIEKMLALIAERREMYAPGEDDRLYNFKESGRRQDCSPERALWGMLDKHIGCLQDIIKRLDKGLPLDRSEGYISEKVGDTITYVALLEGLLMERHWSEEASKTKAVEARGAACDG